MSQEKVDRYKKDKANRQQIMKKEKLEKKLWKIGCYVVLIAIVCWIGYSAYDRYHVVEAKTYEVDTTAVDNYLSDAAAAETEAETETASEDSTEAASEETTEAVSEETTEAASESETEAVSEESTEAASEEVTETVTE